MRRSISLYLFSALLSAVIAFGCGKTTTANVDYGETLGTTWTVDPITCNGSKTFSKSSNNFSISSTSADPCANVVVVITPHTSIPSASAMNLDSATTSLSYDVNATDNGGIYEVSVGDRPYVSSNYEAITLHVPFSTSLITSGYKDNLHIFVRILNKDDNSLADVMGTITSENVVTVTLSGLPSSIYVAAIFNEYMQASAPSNAGADISKDAHENDYLYDVTGNWSTKKWCAVYNKKYVSKLLGITEGAVAAEAQSLVANNAQSIQTIYSALNVTSPNLKEFTGSTDPCGSALGATARYIIYWGVSGNSYSPIDAGEIVPSYGNDYGQMYVPILSAYWTVATNGQTIYGIIGHQMLHAIQDGYEIFGDTTQGYREGTATAFGASLDDMYESGASTYTPSVRSLSDSDTFLLSNFLMLNVDSSSNLATSFSNQDFFVYTANEYGGGTFDYYYNLFRNLQSEIESDDDYAARYSPDRSSLFSALNTTLKQLTDAPTLYTIYTDFLQQRAFDHNANSQLRAGDPTTPGLDADLFAYSAANVAITAIADVPLNPLSIGTELLARFKDVPPLSARVIRITPTQVATTGATINVTLSPSSGSIGTIFQGFAYQNAVAVPISSSMTFSNFGTATTDEILVILANDPNVSGGTSYDIYSIYFTISGTNGS